MEERVARLEEGMRDVKSAVDRLGDKTDRLEAKTDRLEAKTDRLEERMARVEGVVTEIKAILLATLPHLATKAEVADLRTETTARSSEFRNDMVAGFADLRTETTARSGELRNEMVAGFSELRTEMIAGFADKPGKTYMWGILAVLLTAYACGLAGLAILK